MGNTNAKDPKADRDILDAPPVLEKRGSRDTHDGDTAAMHGADGPQTSPYHINTMQPTPVPSPRHHRTIFPQARQGADGEAIPHPLSKSSDEQRQQHQLDGIESEESWVETAESRSASVPKTLPVPLEEMLPPLDAMAVDSDSPSRVVVEGDASEGTVPTRFVWREAASQVMVAGTFNRWEDHVPLQKQRDGSFSTIMHLKPGEYQYKYLVDGEWRHDPDAPTCSNSLGSINNLARIVASALHISGEDSLLLVEETGDGRASPAGEYGQDVPELWGAKPPTLPPQLLDVTLNAQHPSKDPTQLPEPHHVMLSHLYALSIKDNVIVLGCTNRYRKKFVTTVLYKPFEA
ncbi:Prkab1b protein [Salpingoeca rosetta]|uniref:Prkab1b protein n=1 Tax=Salpingoeca rosetta (strain ATCC 50818 / BSB-021) TaxID=946362 RepID=F2TWV4_SALR5|nr:Prkab1b protein [Salpingoeca rosetta]EGD72550.1 Prkab1b protein [Salpingoeca rosetta]|eukprot:XP_004999119.1 Prkab1b protein [Salpingoeca rosetta]